MAERKAKWQNDYIARTYDRINLTVPKGQKPEIQAYAESMGESVNAFINRAMREAMERDGKKEKILELLDQQSLLARKKRSREQTAHYIGMRDMAAMIYAEQGITIQFDEESEKHYFTSE